MAHKKLQATAELFLNTKNAQKDAQLFINDLKQKLSDIESAADKMTVFKDMVAYIAQIDRALAALKANNRDAFDHMFDGLDVNLKQQLESLFGVNGTQLNQLDVLRNKLGELTLKSSIKDVKSFAKEINLLFTSIGINAPFDDIDSIFHGRTTTEYLQRLGSELAKFATVWKNLNFNLSGNFGFGEGSSSGGDGIVSEIQMLINNIEKKNKELLEAKERFDKILEEFNNINKDGISDNYKIDLTEESVKNLTLEYDRLQSELESADASSESFYNTLINLIEISLKLKRAFSDISADDGLKKVFQNASAGTGTGEATLYGLLSRYARSKDPVNKDIQKIIDRGGLQNTINENNVLINELKTSSDINAVIQKRIDLYNQLKAKLHEYNIEQNREFDTDEEEDESFKKLEHMEKEIASLTGATKRLNDIQNVLADLSEDGVVLDDVLQKLYKTLGMETPDVFKERLDSMVAEAKAAMTAIDNISNSGTGGKKESGVGVGGGSGTGAGGAITADVDFTSLENTIKAEAASIANKLDGNTFKVEVVKDNTEGIKSTIGDILSAVQKISEYYHVDKNKTDVDNMKQNLLQLLDVVNAHNAGRTSGGDYQRQELGIALLSDGSLSVNYGDKSSVSWDHMAESLLANLNKKLLGDIHSHPLHELLKNNNQTFVSDSLSGSHGDLGASRFAQHLGAQISGMITGNVLRVLDLSSVTPDMMAKMQKEMDKIEQRYADSGLYSKYIGKNKDGRFGAKVQTTLEDQHQVTKLVESMMYEAFQNVGYSKDYIDNAIFKKYNLTDDAQLTDLATRLVQLVSSAEQAIPPIDRLAEIVSQFGGDTKSAKAKTLFEAYDKGELKASDVFNGLVSDNIVNESAIQSLLNINSAKQMSPIETLLTNISSILSNINTIVGNIESRTQLDSEQQLNNAIKDISDLKSGIINDGLSRGVEHIYNDKDATKYRYEDAEIRAITAINEFVDDFKMKRESGGFTFSESATKDALELVNKFKTAFTYLQDFGKQADLFTGGRNDLGLYVDPSSGKILDSYDTASDMLTNSNVLEALINQLKSIRDKEFDSTETNAIKQLQPVFEKLSMIVDNLSATLSNFNGIPSEQRLPRMDDIFNDSYEGQIDVSNDITNLDILANKVQDIVAEIRGLATEVSGIIESISNPFKGDSEDTSLSTNVELEQLEKLKTQLLEIKAAVDAKTQAFEEEYVTVDSVVDSEITSLQALIDKLQEVVAQVKLVNDEFNQINTDVSQSDIAPKSSAVTKDTHYVMDQQGNPVTMYRGLHDSYSGLVSNRYHGGTFFTDNIELAREYAGELGKVEKVMLSMQYPLEIEGNGAYWNKIEYIGDNADEASQKLHKLKSAVEDLNKLIDHYDKIGPTERELKQIERGFMTEDQTQAKRWMHDSMIERAQKLAEIESIYADTSNPYGRKNTNEIVEIAKASGYDGVIFKNIIDSATGDVTDISNVMVTFAQDQIHYIDTISTTFGDAINTFKNHFGNLTKYIGTTDDEVRDSIKKMFSLRQQVNAGNITSDDYDAFLSENSIARDYDLLAKKSGVLPAMTDFAANDGSYINDIVSNINFMFSNMRERLQKIATAFGKENVPLDQLLNTDLGTTTTTETRADEANIAGEVEQLDRLQSVLAEVKNAIDSKTTAFADEGNVVGQVVDKEVSALTKLSEIIDGIVSKVNLLADGFKGLKVQDINIEKPVVDNVASDDNQSSSGVKDAQPKDPFKDSLRNQKNAFNEYRESLQNVDYMSAELRDELDQLAIKLQQVTDTDSLKRFQAEFNVLQDTVAAKKAAFDKRNFGYINSAENNLVNSFNGLTLKQQLIVDQEYRTALDTLEQYRVAVKNGKDLELKAIYDVVSALRQKLETYKEVNREAKRAATTKNENANFGSTATINATAKYNSLSKMAKSEQFAGSSEVSNAFAQYDQIYKRVIERQNELRNSGKKITDFDKEAFKELTTECNNYAKALEKIINSSLKLKSKKVNPDDYMLGDDFVDDKEGRIAALTDFVQKMYGVNVAAEDFKDGWNKVVFAVDNGDGTFTQMTATFTDARNEIVALAGDTKKAQGAFANFFDELKGKFKSIGAYLVASFSFHEVWSVIRQGVNYVREIDSALTELKKVTDETDASYAQFLQDMSKTGSVIGATVADLTTMASEWARLGYSMEEAGKLAESTAILLNVSEFDDATNASEALISTMQAFQYTADQSQHVVDVLNEVGNNFAVSSDGIATALQDSASALMEGGNNLEQAVALVAAANRVVQDPNSVGSALRTISLRLRGTSVEVLEEIGEETDGVVESTSKLQEKIKALSGVDILTDAGDYKDTYTILKEIGNVWEDMSDIDQAALLELMAGKNRANTLSAILSNMTDLEGAYESALNAEGSALKENKAYLDSIQGRIDLFNNSVQTMWMNFIDSEVVKFIVDLGTGLIKLVDNIGLIETALMGVVAYLTLIKKQNISESLFGGLLGGKKNKISLLKGSDLDDEIERFNTALASGAEVFGEYKVKAKEAGNGMDILATKLEQGAIKTKNGKVAAEDYTIALQSQSKAATKAASAEKMKNMAIGLSVMAISGIISAIQSYTDSIKTLEERYEELQSNISTIESDISSLDSELESIEEQIDALSNKNLTITEAEELRKLKEQSTELQKQKELRANILSVYSEQNEITTLEMFNKKLSETAANQEKAKESAKAWAKGLGTLADVLLVIGGIAVTGATFGGATALGAAMMGAGMSGTATSLAGMAADTWGGSSKSVGEDLTAWYDSYVDAIANADKAAAEAESKYLSDVSDANYDAWQKKLEVSNALKEDLYNNLEELQSYISNLEYNDTTASTIDKFNDLITHISVKTNDGNIETQISSIKSLQDEFYELSRGVDENGKNVALSAEEYARYRDIVDQILSYAPGLIQGYDDEGNAILGAADAQFTYNQLLVQSIELLREQRRLAAQDIISTENIQKTYDDVQNAFQSDIENIDSSGLTTFVPGSGNAGGFAYTTNHIEDVIEGVVGKSESWWADNITTDPTDFIKNNLNIISQKLPEIQKAIAENMLDNGFTQEETDEYVNIYMEWLSGLIAQCGDATEKANSKIREMLYSAPQSSEYYYDMSGEQLNFINSYIYSLEGLKDKTKDEIKGIADGIVDLMSLINSSGSLQDSINDIMTLDPSSMPVDAYRKKFEELWAEAGAIIPVEQQEAFRNYLFPDEAQIDQMIADVQQKLATGSKGLAKNLSLEELRIAYKIIPELKDNISFDELRKEIQERLPKATGPIVETYSTLVEQVEKFNEVAVQTSEIILNNTKVTQEYKDSLVELGVSEEEIAECFDSTNNLVVTNAKKLNDLVKSAKKNTTQNVRLAKSQARLQYYELYKKMALLVDANGKVASGNVDLILSYYKEMNALEKTIARYSMLEAQLLGATNAYEEFQEAQEIDSVTDYIGNAEDMVVALGKAFNTAELGSETAQAAIMGLVPESVYKDLDTLDEKMAAIYNYFKKGKIAQYFDLSFDEDGNIESAEMKLGNLRKFIEDGLWGDNDGDKINPFVGSDWKHFELNQTWLDSLPEGTDVLQALADQMNVTKEVAFAFVKSLKDHDIEWLNGDYATFFDQMLASTNEGKIQLYTERLADVTAEKAKLVEEEEKLTKQLKDGSITQEEYDAKIAELTKKQEEYNKKLTEYNNKLAEAKNASLQNIFGVGAKDTQYEGKTDYQIKTSSEIEATNDLDGLDNWIERNEKVEQLYEDQEEAQKEYTKALEDHAAAVEANGGKELDVNHETVVALKEAEKKYKAVTNAVAEAIKKRDELDKPTVLEIEVAIDEVEKQIESTKKTLDEKLASGTHTITIEIDGQTIQQDVTSTEQLLDSCFHIDEDGYWVINAGVDKSELEQKYPEILNYVNLLNSNTTLNAFLNDTEVQVTIDDLSTQIQEIIDLLEGMKINLDPDSVTEFSRQLGELCKPRNIVTYIGSFVEGLTSDGESGPQKVNGTAHAYGTAHKSGNWGLPQSERNSLVGELGPEMVVDPSTGRYYTVGDNGAEMVDLPKGAIIFNHKQTEGLLKNGYVTSRGKAYAEGNAHVTIWPDASSKTQWKGTGYSGPDDPTWDAAEALSDSASAISDALDDAADSVNEFEETMDWIEIRMEEFDERIGKLSAELENLTTYEEKNAKITEIITENQKKYSDSLAGAKYYEDYAQKYLDGMNSTLVEAAKNGAIAITEFTKEQDEATVNAIQNYREYAQKAADLYQQAEEIITEIADLAKQAFDNVVSDFENELSFNDIRIEQYEAHNSLLETDKGFASENIYQKIIEENEAKIKILEQQREAMQAELDSGKIEVGSDDWYDAVNAISEVDTEIINLNTEIEDIQDSINELHWEQFDLLMTQFQAVSDEAENLIDILGTKDVVDELGNWTDEGITSIGLLAQQMEVAEKQADKYKQEIEYLNENWKDLGYTQEEYVEKLDELKSGQYDAIKSYNDAKDAIVDLNKARVDAIKDGIEKEIEAYEELIEAKKEALDAEKDLHDFQKGVMEQQKDIAAIERQLAALSNDNSASARAKRAQLEAELYEAKANLEETYYDRSISDQQDALDKELEGFQKQKEEEIEGWEKYLESVELVVADSLAMVQENTNVVLQTLTTIGQEFGLTITEALTAPWKAGETAIQEYGAKLNISLTQLAAMFGMTVDQFAVKLGLTTTELVSSLDITVAQLAETLGLTSEEMAARLGLTVTNLNGMMDMSIQQLAANIGITLPILAERLGTTTAGLAGNLEMTMIQFAGKMGLTVDELASKFGLTTTDLATKLGMTYQDLVNPFGLAMSATVEALKALELEYSNILASITGDSEIAINEVNKAMQTYEDAKNNKQQPPAQNTQPEQPAAPIKKTVDVGSRVNAGSARIYADSYGGGGGTQYFASDPNYIVLKKSNGYVLVRHHSLSSGYTGWFKESDLKAYAKGSKGVEKDQWAILDELGEELQLVPDGNGRLAYIKKGTAILNNTMTERLMDLAMNPQEMLDRSRPKVAPSKSVINNTMEINMEIAEVVHIDSVNNDTIPDLTKAVRKELDSYMIKLNNAIKAKVR